jgi:hypothetical protein
MASPPDSSNSNSISDSPPQTLLQNHIGGDCSLQQSPGATTDPFLPELAEWLSYLTRAGFDATHLLRSAAAAGPLPDDHPAAALWWRILDQLPQPAEPNRQGCPNNEAPSRDGVGVAPGATSGVRLEPLSRARNAERRRRCPKGPLPNFH